MDGSELARQMAALRRRRPKTCPICGTEFEAFGKQAYCTKLCANKASYRRIGRARRTQADADPARSVSGRRFIPALAYTPTKPCEREVNA
jgi:hypothetical protein